MKLRFLALVLASICISLPGAGKAEAYSEGLSKCIIKNTSTADRQDLVRWIFVAMARHPDLVAYASIKPSENAEITKATARLFERLMTVDCRSETIEVLRNEGLKGIEKGFGFLGETAMYELMGNSKVNEALGELDKQLDQSKFDALDKELAAPTPPTPK